MELSYCTNVHPAEDLPGIVRQLDEHAGPVRRAAGLERLGVGLWMPVGVASLLSDDPRARGVLADALARNGLELRTVNAFPYRGFHDDVVKLAVYRPDWTTRERLEYTLDCARALAALLPAGAEGSISTLPLGWRRGGMPRPTAPRRNTSPDSSRASPRSSARRDASSAWRSNPSRLHPRRRRRRGGLARRPPAPDRRGPPRAVPGHLPPRRVVRRPRRSGRRGRRRRHPHRESAGLGRPRGARPRRPPHGGRAPALRRGTLRPPGARGRGSTLRRRPPRGARRRRAVADRPRLARARPHPPARASRSPPPRHDRGAARRGRRGPRDPHGGDAHLDIETYTWSVLPEELQPETLVGGIAAELRWAHAHLPRAVAGVPASGIDERSLV